MGINSSSKWLVLMRPQVAGFMRPLTNSIVWNNFPEDLYVDEYHWYGLPTINFCCFQGEWVGDSNIHEAPGFAFSNDYHLTSISPCIDAGTNSPSGQLPTTDLDGNPRPIDGNSDSDSVADIGIYEYNPSSPSIAISSISIDMYVLQGNLDINNSNLLVRNCGGMSLNWTIAEDSLWLNPEPVSGSSDGDINSIILGVDANGLSHGQYTCQIVVSDPNAVNNLQITIVTLHINDTLRVPEQYSTIQEALDDAVDGDTVLIADGTYTGAGNKELDFQGKHIVVRSEHGPDNCIIDCQNVGRAFYFHNQEDSNSILDGFAIINGSADRGGGVNCSGNSSPTIINCVISDNSATEYGGGICCYDLSQPLIANCKVSNNLATCGGGILSSYSRQLITNCTITGNSAQNGGGLDLEQGKQLVENSIITNNSANNGGGIYCGDTTALITNCTVVNNSAINYGGGIYCIYDSWPILRNSILWDNTAPSGPEIALINPYMVGSALTIDYSDVRGGSTLAYVGLWCYIDWGSNNIEENPLFITDNYHLSIDSPCINKGINPSDFRELTDIDGNERILYSLIDIGADEVFPISGDFDHNEDINVLDLNIFINHWLSNCSGPDWCDNCDIDRTNFVDIRDFAKLAKYWLVSGEI
jgi:predicted outer membrane repeat protein